MECGEGAYGAVELICMLVRAGGTCSSRPLFGVDG